MTHTPGPWTAYTNKTGWGVRSGPETDPLWVATNDVGAEWNNQANARLIAAAPELLEALDEAATMLYKAGADYADSVFLDAAREAKAVINKATGN